MLKFRRLLRLSAILLVAALALNLRLRAVARLPIDYDEDDYLGAAQRYAAYLRAGDWNGLINYDYNSEHPPLPKIVYGLAISPLPPAPLLAQLPPSTPPVDSLPQPHFLYARLVSTALGWLEVVALAVFNPLAAFLLGIQTWQIKYTTQVMLEALPSLTSCLTVLFYIRGRAGAADGRGKAWWALSAGMLGLTAASKYTYCLVGLAILIDWLWAAFPRATPRWTAATFIRWLAPPALWGGIALLVFVAFDPRLWVDGVNRLKETLLYHAAYSQSAYVRRAGLPWWQPFVWLSESVPWHPGVFVAAVDGLISFLAVVGLPRIWRKQRVLALWLGIALVFLLWWNTKWPQYILVLTVPLAASAAEGLAQFLGEPLARWVRETGSHFVAQWRTPRARLARPAEWLPPFKELRRPLPWLLPGGVALVALVGVPLVYQMGMALTDLNGMSIRDGVQGGVWREVWLGLTGQVKPVNYVPFGVTNYTQPNVHYAGPDLLFKTVLGVGDVLVFEVLWMAFSVALQGGLGIGVALVLHQRGLKLAGMWRTIFILPWAIPEFIGALIWLRVFEPQIGWLNQALPPGVTLPPNFDNPLYTLVMLAVAATWYGFPFIMLAASAGLKLVPAEVYAAAALDGASGWALFQQITWPLLFPLVAPALIIRAIFAFNQFYLFYVMRLSYPQVTLATLSYEVFYFHNQYAFSAALNLLTVAILIVLLVWFSRRSKAGEGVTYA